MCLPSCIAVWEPPYFTVTDWPKALWLSPMCHRMRKRSRQRSESFPFVAFDLQPLSFLFLSSLSSPRCYTFIMSPDFFRNTCLWLWNTSPVADWYTCSMFLRFIIFAPSSVSSCVVSVCCVCARYPQQYLLESPHALVRFPPSVVAGCYYSLMAKPSDSIFGGSLVQKLPFDSIHPVPPMIRSRHADCCWFAFVCR